MNKPHIIPLPRTEDAMKFRVSFPDGVTKVIRVKERGALTEMDLLKAEIIHLQQRRCLTHMEY